MTTEMPVLHRQDFARRPDTCTCPTAPCGGTVADHERPHCPWHDTAPVIDWAATYHRADTCPKQP